MGFLGHSQTAECQCYNRFITQLPALFLAKLCPQNVFIYYSHTLFATYMLVSWRCYCQHCPIHIIHYYIIIYNILFYITFIYYIYLYYLFSPFPCAGKVLNMERNSFMTKWEDKKKLQGRRCRHYQNFTASFYSGLLEAFKSP